jgi:hypothetical protein
VKYAISTIYSDVAELERLLGTATDEERKDMIQKAINALDATEPTTASPQVANNFIQSLHPATHAHLFAKVCTEASYRSSRNGFSCRCR